MFEITTEMLNILSEMLEILTKMCTISIKIFMISTKMFMISTKNYLYFDQEGWDLDSIFLDFYQNVRNLHRNVLDFDQIFKISTETIKISTIYLIFWPTVSKC